ncbi:MAG: non-heme iron oxygenase ferredoxin subunit [Candidatus Eremiobacteraeota bacterium]|nr:non-heme iron oxygenase ferredoxin subunit [Candidatus Eremiobacteraeota bacterium]
MSSVKIAKTADVPDGTAIRAGLAGSDILICNAGGQFYAIEDVCTHDGGELDQGVLDGCEIECPRHGARFDVRTGAALTLPAVLPVRTYPVRVEGEDIFIER